MAGNKTIYDTAMKRAHEYAWANQWDRALKEYGRALQEFPNDRTAQRNMAQCMFTLRQWPQAMSAYENLLSADPTDAFAINRLAEIYLALGQQDRARATYDRLADLYLQNNQFDKLTERLERERREADKQREMTICIAQAYQTAGDLGTARQQLERLLTENARDTQLLQQLSQLAGTR